MGDNYKLDTQRAYLEERNGIPELELCDASQIERARELFLRDGFVVVRDVLSKEQLDLLLFA